MKWFKVVDFNYIFKKKHLIAQTVADTLWQVIDDVYGRIQSHN